MMTLEQVKENLLKEVSTPIGNKILYGVNVLPTNLEVMLLFFYNENLRCEYFSLDCFIIEQST